MRTYVFRFDGRLLVSASRELPEAPHPSLAPLDEIALGAGTTHRVVVVDDATEAPEGHEWKSLRSFLGRWDDAEIALGGRAAQLATFLAQHRFCGRCGAPTVTAEAGRAKACTRCELRVWPRLSPCVMVRIDRDDTILLARNAQFPVPFFSVLAGFVDPGETLEECVAREVREEVGLEVRDVRYFGSQPWPFPHSLMIAFTARYAGGDIVVDGEEIAEAAWYRADALPPVPPPFSIAGRLIAAFVESQSR